MGSQRIVLTGAAGFIASNVAAQLLEQGHEVIGIDNLNDAYDVRLKGWRLNRLRAFPAFTFHQADVSHADAMRALWGTFPAVDAVIHLAARAGVRQSVENPQVYVDTNVTGTLNLLNACRDHAVPKFILASSSSVYGTQNPMPYREDADTSRPLSPYAATKISAEAMSHAYHQLFGFDVTVFRYFTVYGEAGRPDMAMFRFIQAIYEGRPLTVYGDGSMSRDFTYVGDTARGTILGLGLSGYHILNLGSDHPVAVMDVIRTIEARLGKPAQLVYKPAHAADVQATWADITRARALIGWQPEIPYAEGIDHAVRWYLDNREWACDIAP